MWFFHRIDTLHFSRSAIWHHARLAMNFKNVIFYPVTDNEIRSLLVTEGSLWPALKSNRVYLKIFHFAVVEIPQIVQPKNQCLYLASDRTWPSRSREWCAWSACQHQSQSNKQVALFKPMGRQIILYDRSFREKNLPFLPWRTLSLLIGSLYNFSGTSKNYTVHFTM